jgi:hypothetical protein
MNFTQWGDKLTWESVLKRPQKITLIEWDLMLWMTSDYEIEIQAQSMDNTTQHELFCHNFGGHWSVKHGKFFRILEECMDFQTWNMKGWDKGCILRLIRTYDTISIGRAIFLRALKVAVL